MCKCDPRTRTPFCEKCRPESQLCPGEDQREGGPPQEQARQMIVERVAALRIIAWQMGEINEAERLLKDCCGNCAMPCKTNFHGSIAASIFMPR